LGRLQVVDVAQTISAAEADRLIKEELAKTGEPHFAFTKLAARLREARSGRARKAKPLCPEPTNAIKPGPDQAPQPPRMLAVVDGLPPR
jgi:hypothetical protein